MDSYLIIKFQISQQNCFSNLQDKIFSPQWIVFSPLISFISCTILFGPDLLNVSSIMVIIRNWKKINKGFLLNKKICYLVAALYNCVLSDKWPIDYCAIFEHILIQCAWHISVIKRNFFNFFIHLLSTKLPPPLLPKSNLSILRHPSLLGELDDLLKYP